MPRYKLIVEYDGSAFSGMQRQESTAAITQEAKPASKRPRYSSQKDGRKKGAPRTIQDCLEQALLGWTGCDCLKELRMRFAGRTDKGVHALHQVVAVDLPLVDKEKELWELCRATNSRLPQDIVVLSFERCDNFFEPRYQVKLKEYTYTLRYRRLVLRDGTALPLCGSGVNLLRRVHDPACIWVCPWALDDSKLQSLCDKLAGTHDYSSFVHKEERKKQSNVLHLSKFQMQVLLETQEEAPAVTVKFLLQAKGFRRSMVRNLVGFVVDVCRGKVKPDQLESVWTCTDEAAALVHAAPASGLCLANVQY